MPSRREKREEFERQQAETAQNISLERAAEQDAQRFSPQQLERLKGNRAAMQRELEKLERAASQLRPGDANGIKRLAEQMGQLRKEYTTRGKGVGGEGVEELKQRTDGIMRTITGKRGKRNYRQLLRAPLDYGPTGQVFNGRTGGCRPSI
jgi:hypothetical protein